MVHLTPGDPVEAVIGQGAMVKAEVMDKIRSELGLDEPLHIQYLSFIGRVVRGDLGMSYRSRRPVIEEVKDRFPVTLKLIVPSIVLSTLLGIAAGVLAAAKHDTWFDGSTMVLAIVWVSMPSFWFGLLLIYLFAVNLGWLPVAGTGGPQFFVLPVAALSMRMAALVARLSRSSMLEVLGMDYIQTARAKGLSERIVLYRHALRNALNPVVTVIGLRIGALLAGSVIIEQVFALPGTGRLLVHSIQGRDFPAIQGLILLLAFLFVVSNLLVDVIYGFLDPRITYS
jgi:ABC-type dipeptide/oligopeptide/nickel transport system permease component